MANVNSSLTDVCNEIALALQNRLGTKDKYYPIHYAEHILAIGTQANALASDVIAGKKVYIGSGYIVGTFARRDLVIQDSDILAIQNILTPPAGSYYGQVTIPAQPGLRPENIKKGVTIFGVTGTLEEKPAITKLATPVITLVEGTGTFSYQITSWSNVMTSSMTITISDGLGNTTTENYSSSMSAAKSVNIGAGANMTIAWTSQGTSPKVTVTRDGVPTIYEQQTSSVNIDLKFGDVIDITFYESCLTGDTLITLADGTEKRIDQLTMNDRVLGYNPDTLELVSQKLTFCDANEEKYGDEFVRYTFSDGKHVDTVNKHAFYNSDTGLVGCLDAWELGMHARTMNGTMPELVKVETFKGKVRHYTIFTEYDNYFANGLLSGNRFTKRLFFDLYKEEME